MDGKRSLLENRRLSATVLLASLLALLVLGNVILNAFATRFSWYFYTEERYEHTVGEASLSLFSELDEGKEVRVLFCMSEEKLLGDTVYALVLNTVRQLAERHDFIKIEFKNIFLHPGEVKPFRTRTTATGETIEYPITEQSVIFVSGEDESVFRVEALESFFILDEERTITAYNGEEMALSCLSWVLHDRHPVAAFTASHGENFGELLGFYTTLIAAGYDIDILDLAKDVPEGVGLVVVANPRWDFDRSAEGSGVVSELDRLAAFLDRGGSLFVSLDPYAKSDLSGLAAFLVERGLSTTREVIRDLRNSVTHDGYTLVTELADTPLAGALSDRVGTYTDKHALVREASVISCLSVGGWQAEALLSSSPTSVAYENGVAVRGEGSYPVLAASRRTVGDTTSTVLLSSSVYFLANDAINSAGYANRDTVLAALELASGRAVPVGCRILPIGNERLEDLTMRTARLYAVLLVLAPPILLGALGGALILRRKNR